MNRLLLAIILSLCTYTTALAQWVPVTNPQNKALHSVFFINSTTGFTCGDTATVLKSTNGGSSWFSINSGIPSSVNLTDIAFLDQNTGYCTGGLGSISGKIYKSTNGGVNWVQKYDTSGTGFRTLFFVNVNTGWVVGAGGVIKFTSNGGDSWLPRDVNISSLTDVYALSEDTVFVSGFGSGGSIVKSTNGGVNWTFTSVPGDFADFKFVMFVNSSTGYAGGLKFGGNGIMGKTTNKGLNWTTLTGYVSATPYEAANVTDDLVYVVRTDDTVSVTTDGGITWSKQYAQTGGFDKSISVKNGLGVTAGRNLAINTTVGIHILSSEIPGDFSLKQNYPNPFNPSTSIEFSVPQKSFVKLIVYNVLGQEVKTLLNEVKEPASYKVDFSAISLPSGVYFYKLEAEGFIETKRMILVK